MPEPTETATITTTGGTRIAGLDPTEYVVLARDGSGLWIQAEKTVKARSAEAAIRSLETEGTYVAVPARSWKPTKVQAVQTTTLKLEEAK